MNDDSMATQIHVINDIITNRDDHEVMIKPNEGHSYPLCPQFGSVARRVSDTNHGALDGDTPFRPTSESE